MPAESMEGSTNLFHKKVEWDKDDCDRVSNRWRWRRSGKVPSEARVDDGDDTHIGTG